MPLGAGIENGLSDAELVQRIAAKDHEAFRVVMKRYNQTLFRTARAILKNDTEAEDAVQEGYLLAYCAMGSFRGDAKLSTWLVRIIANEALGRLRKSDRSAEIIRFNGEVPENISEDYMNQSHSGRPEGAASRAQTRKLLETKIDELPDAYRAVFVLRAIEEMSVEEVAVALAIPEATVRTRFFRARSLLRAALSTEIDLAYGDAFAFAGERCDRITANVLARLDQAAASRG